VALRQLPHLRRLALSLYDRDVPSGLESEPLLHPVPPYTYDPVEMLRRGCPIRSHEWSANVACQLIQMVDGLELVDIWREWNGPDWVEAYHTGTHVDGYLEFRQREHFRPSEWPLGLRDY
jgi:hypothetical protein